MLAMAENDDQWVAAVASYVRKSFGNDASMISPADVAGVRASVERSEPWTYDALLASVPALVQPGDDWKVTASHNSEGAAGALNFAGWNTAAPQEPGMWFQVELPQAVAFTELQFDSPMQRLRRGPPGAGGPGGGGPPVFIPTAPAGYRVEISMDGQSWGEPVAQGSAASSSTTVSFAPKRGRFLRITQTGDPDVEGDPSWAMVRLRLFERQAGQ